MKHGKGKRIEHFVKDWIRACGKYNISGPHVVFVVFSFQVTSSNTACFGPSSFVLRSDW